MEITSINPPQRYHRAFFGLSIVLEMKKSIFQAASRSVTHKAGKPLTPQDRRKEEERPTED